VRDLGARFLRIGSTGFGGPMALLGLMQQQLVERSEEVTPDEFAEGVAVGQMLPGPVAVGCATFLGYRLRGIPGAIVTTGALILPSFLLMLIIAPLYLQHGRLPVVSGFFLGVAPAVIAVIAFAGWRLGKSFITDWRSAVIAVAVAAAAILQAHPILLILLGGVLGLILRRPRAKEATA
jgi:chromate transporter